MPNHLLTLKQALLAPNNAAALRQVQQHADMIRNTLREEDLELSDAELKILGADPVWAGAVYGALADADQPEDNTAIQTAIDTILHDASMEISDGFLALIELLQSRRYDWLARFTALPQVADDIYAYLAVDPTVAPTFSISQPLLVRGITPSMIFAACRGLQLLFDRLGRRRPAGAPPAAARLPATSAALGASVRYGDAAAPVGVPRELLYSQISATPNLPEEGADVLLWWITDVLAVQPLLIPGYRCDTPFTFTAMPETATDYSLVALWGAANGTSIFGATQQTYATRPSDIAG